MELTWQIAAVWIGLALAATLISIRIGISVALVEIVVGTIGGNLLDLRLTPWINFLAGFGSIMLTFLAGAEIDLQVMKAKWKETLSIGFASFLMPFLGASA